MPPGSAGRASEPPHSRPPGAYQARSTVALKAFRGLFWMASTGLGSRIVSLISTLLLTRYVAPEDYGEVQNTFIVVWMVDLLTQLGLPQYIAGRADLTPKKIYHATLYFHLFGILGLGLCLVLARPLGPWFGAPNMPLYMPGFVLGVAFTRVATIPDRILVRDLKFRVSGMIRAMGEVIYAVVSLGLAYMGTKLDFELFGIPLIFGAGFAIVWGNITRGLFRVIAVFMVTRIRDWFALVRLERETTKELFGFGVPITVAALGSLGARRWDNLVIGNLYGPGTSGIYNFAYNLADVPPSVVGEAVGDVLAPSFAKVSPPDRPKELVRWIAISALVCFPLGIGLSAVADSLTWMFHERWISAVPMLVLLGSLSLTRPVIGTLFSYLQMLGRTRLLMILEWAKAGGIVVTMLAFGHALKVGMPQYYVRFGPLAACGAVGVVMVANTLSYQVLTAREAKIPAWSLISPVIRPLLACVPLVLGVLGVRLSFGHAEGRWMMVARLACEVLVGGLVFVGSAWLIARRASVEFLDLLKSAIRRRRTGGAD